MSSACMRGLAALVSNARTSILRCLLIGCVTTGDGAIEEVRKTMSTVLANPAEMIRHGAPHVIHNDAELEIVLLVVDAERELPAPPALFLSAHAGSPRPKDLIEQW